MATDLTGNKIRLTYNQVVHTPDGNTFYDGTGSLLNIGGDINTGSFVTTSSFNAFTSSVEIDIDNLTSQTGSYAVTASNDFIGDQTINGVLTITGSEQCNLHMYSTTAGGGLSLRDNTTTDDDQVGIGALGNNLCFRAGGAPAGNMRLLDNGNLGIGNLEPSEKLTVEGNISASGDVFAQGLASPNGDTGDTYIYRSTNEELTLSTGGNDQFILSNDELGISDIILVNIEGNADVGGTLDVVGNITSDARVTSNTLLVNANSKMNGELNLVGGLSASGLLYPDTDGTTGQVMTTDGAGNLSFQTVGGGGSATQTFSLTFEANLSTTEYYYGSSRYGWNYIIWTARDSDMSIFHTNQINGMIVNGSYTTIHLNGVGGNFSAAGSVVDFQLWTSPNPNGSTSNVNPTLLASQSVTMTTQNALYEVDFGATGLTTTAGDLIWLTVRKPSGTGTNFVRNSLTITLS